MDHMTIARAKPLPEGFFAITLGTGIMVLPQMWVSLQASWLSYGDAEKALNLLFPLECSN
ncbi:hypothetical protein SLEP1_g20644 [Rubroshorea leprosula]|uniref:Uncharacterized protein n=1 Tax=Rubroshorea leprosula TaxID=152421 RepID=A0AAV5J3D7_9ROSI|nr:hypothetical protein SLEP1_g20644 [Rubroshorea leprosula]